MAVEQQAPTSNAEPGLPIEIVPITDLRPHPRNYQEHPADQIAHLIASLQANGLYRPVVTARDGTILAGHGLAKAAAQLGYQEIAIVRLDLDPNESRALKVMTADNEIHHLAERDDRALSQLLKQIKDEDLTGLVGTGYDEMMLANLVIVTRPASEIRSLDEAAAWVGMPKYEEGQNRCQLVIAFDTDNARQVFVDAVGIEIKKKVPGTWSASWPNRPNDDRESVRYSSGPR